MPLQHACTPPSTPPRARLAPPSRPPTLYDIPGPTQPNPDLPPNRLPWPFPHVAPHTTTQPVPFTSHHRPTLQHAAHLPQPLRLTHPDLFRSPTTALFHTFPFHPTSTSHVRSLPTDPTRLPSPFPHVSVTTSQPASALGLPTCLPPRSPCPPRPTSRATHPRYRLPFPVRLHPGPADTPRQSTPVPALSTDLTATRQPTP